METGATVELPPSTCQLSGTFWCILAELPKMAWKLFPDERGGLGRQGSKVVTALNDTLFFWLII